MSDAYTYIRVTRQGFIDTIPLSSGQIITRDSLANPGASDARVKIVRGSRREVMLDNGNVQETFSLYGKGRVADVRADYNRIKNALGDMMLPSGERDYSVSVELVDKADTEPSARVYQVYSGRIQKVDNEIVDWYMDSGHSLYAITVERSAKASYGITNETNIYGVKVGAHGGKLTLRKNLTGETGGRIKNLVLRAYSGERNRKFWAGIFPNKTGSMNFDPEVKIGTGSVSIMSADTSVFSSDADANDGSCVHINFSDEEDWKIRFNVPIERWNDTSASYPQDFNGNYHLVVRYKVSNGAAIGARFGVGWGGTGSIDWGQRFILRPIIDGTQTEWHYEDFGVISVGSSLWDNQMMDRFSIGGAKIYCDAQRSVGDDKSWVRFDNAYLIPADNFLFVDVGYDYGPESRVEVLTSPLGDIHAYLVDSGVYDSPGKPLSVKRKISDKINTVSHNGWTCPEYEMSYLVLLGDKGVSMKGLGAYFRVDMAIELQTDGYANYA